MAIRYEKYKLEDFVADESFQDWVRLGKHDSLWRDFISSEPKNLGELRKAEALLAQLKFKSSEFPADQKFTVWKNIEKETNPNLMPRTGLENESIKDVANGTPVRQISPWSNLRPLIALAAVLASLFFAWQLFQNNNLVVQTQLAEHTEHRLPDGTTVFLNADSKISYNEKNFKEDRILSLTGEAFFDVESGSSFKVKAGQGTVEVLGTEFNVKNRDGNFLVDCFEGRVSVKHRKYIKEIFLDESQSWSLDGGESSEKFVNNPADRLAWNKGRFVFRSAEMSSVFRELERQYEVDVNYAPSGTSDLFTGHFSAGDLDQALKQICWPKKLTYKIVGSQVSISRE